MKSIDLRLSTIKPLSASYCTAQVQGNVRTRPKRVRDASETRSRRVRDAFEMRAGRVRD